MSRFDIEPPPRIGDTDWPMDGPELDKWLRLLRDFLVTRDGFSWNNLNALLSVTREPCGFDLNTPTSMGDISFVDGTRTFTIEPQATEDSFYFYQLGVKKEFKTAQTVTITDTEGLWFIYYDGTGTLVSSQTPWTFGQGLVFVANLYWDATNNTAIILGDERHGMVMDWATHDYFHDLFGAQWKEGFLPSVTIGSGTLDAHCEMQSVSAGEFYDEDIEISNPQQTTYRIYYKDGASGYWRATTASAALVDMGVSFPYYNEWTGAVWQRTEVANNKYTLAHVFAGNDTTNKVYIVMGENEYLTLADAQEGATTELANLELDGFPSVEHVSIATMIIHCKSTYSNAYQAVVDITADGGDFIDWRGNLKVLGAGSGSSGSALPFIHLTKSAAQNIGGANGTNSVITWDGTPIATDPTFTHSTTVNPQQITVNVDGRYSIYYNCGATQGGTGRTTLMSSILINGATFNTLGRQRNYSRGSSYGDLSIGIQTEIDLQAGDYIEIVSTVDDTDAVYTINTVAAECECILRKLS